MRAHITTTAAADVLTPRRRLPSCYRFAIKQSVGASSGPTRPSQVGGRSCRCWVYSGGRLIGRRQTRTTLGGPRRRPASARLSAARQTTCGQRVVAGVDSRGGRANARSTGAGKRLRRSGLDRNYSDGVLTTGSASTYHKNSADCLGQSDAADRSLDQLCTVARFEHLYAPADFVYAHRSAL